MSACASVRRFTKVSDCLRAVHHRGGHIFEYAGLPVLSAPRPRLERGTYCLGDNPETWPGVARCGLTCRLTAARMAGRGLAWPRACGRWLPVWLPVIVSNANVRRARSRHRCLRASPRQRSSRPRHRPAPRDGVPAVTPGCAMTPRLAREAVTVGQIARRCARLACSRRPPPTAHAVHGPRSTASAQHAKALPAQCRNE